MQTPPCKITKNVVLLQRHIKMMTSMFRVKCHSIQVIALHSKMERYRILAQLTNMVCGYFCIEI